MGCAGSGHMVPAAVDSIPQQQIVTALNSIPKTEVLKDLPDVVDKVIDVMKGNDLETISNKSNESDNQPVAIPKEDISTTENQINKMFRDSERNILPQAIEQGVINENASSIIKIDVHDCAEELKKNSPPTSGESDSLRTSSPESEIEEALANSNDRNPPTPTPTFSELQQLGMLPLTTLAIPQDDNTKPPLENSKIIDNLNKTEFKTPMIARRDTTEWEKQADILATIQKYNPIDTMRKFRRQARASSATMHKPDFRPKMQRYLDDLEQFSAFQTTIIQSSPIVQTPIQTPSRSRLSSAKSELSTNANSENSGSSTKVKAEVPEKKTITKSKKPEIKRKENKLTVPQNGKVAPASPGLYKVRERCAVCCIKYKK